MLGDLVRVIPLQRDGASQIWDVERALDDYISRSESRSLLNCVHYMITYMEQCMRVWSEVWTSF